MLLELLPYALCSAAYPTLLAMVMVMLGRPSPKRLIGGFLFGAMTMSLTVGFVVIALLRSGHTLSGSSGRTISPVVDLAVGALLLGLLAMLLTGGRLDRIADRRAARKAEKEAKAKEKAREKGKDPWSKRVLSGGSVKLAILAGFVLNLPGALYLVSLKDIAESNATNTEVVVAVVFYNLIMFQWAELPLIGYAIAPDRTQAAVTRFYDWLGAHTRTIAITLLAAVGLYLAAKGIVGLV